MFSDAPERFYYRMAMIGKTVKFPCPTTLPEDVDWVRLATSKSRRRYIYYGNIGLRDLGLDPRLMVLGKSQSHTLVIYNVTVNDTAFYHCTGHSGLGKQRFYGLSVEGKFNFLHMYVVSKARRYAYSAVLVIVNGKSVCPSVYHIRGLCSHGSTYDHDFFTVWQPRDSSFLAPNFVSTFQRRDPQIQGQIQVG